MSLSIGKILGVEIKLHYTWFIIFMLVTWTLAADYMPSQFPGAPQVLYWLTGVVSAFVLFASVLFHELMHSYIARRKGLPVPSITLHFFGGVSRIAEEPKSPNVEFTMAVIGPLSSFALSALFAVILFVASQLSLGPVIIAPLTYASLINLLLGSFNLLPAFPLDGGRMLRAGIWRWKDDLLSATRLSTKIGEGIAYTMMGIGFIVMLFGAWINGLWLIFIGWFIKSGSESSLRHTIVSQALSDVNVEDIMNPEVITLPPEKGLEETVEFFYQHKHGGFPVVKAYELLGVITLQDIKEVPKQERAGLKVRDAMTSKEKLVFVKPSEPAVEAMIKLSRHDVGRLPVMDNGKLVGIITRSDVMKAIRAKTELQ